MVSNKISIKDLSEGYTEVKDRIREIEIEEARVYDNEELLDSEFQWGQAGAAMTVLELTNDNYYNFRKIDNRVDVIDRYRI